MKSVILVAVALAVVVTAAPPLPATLLEVAKIIRSEFDQKPEGGYNFAFETDNGIIREESAQLKEIIDADNKPQVVLTVRGSYSYNDSEGKLETVQYYADETGYHADGPSVPKNPQTV